MSAEISQSFAGDQSSFRWFVLAVVLLSQLCLVSVLFAPAAVAQLILDDLQITNAQFGLIMSVTSLTVLLCVVFASVLVDRFGVKTSLLLGLLALGIGGSAVALARSFPFLLATRAVLGVGIAVSYPVLGALVMDWFSGKERPYVNTAFAAFAFLGTGVAFLATAEFIHLMDSSWEGALSVYGLVTLALAIAWAAKGKSRTSSEVQPGTDDANTEPSGSEASGSSLGVALRLPVTWMLSVGLFATGWIYNMYFSFTPLFLQNDRGLSLTEAGRLASTLPFSGVAGVIVFGLLSNRTAWRKHLLWISCVVVIVGSLGLFFGSGLLMRGGLLVTGFGMSGFLPVSVTYMMALPNMTPSLVAAFLVMINVGTYLAGFAAPFFVGWLSQTSLGLTNTLALLTWVELIAIAMFIRLPATE